MILEAELRQAIEALTDDELAQQWRFYAGCADNEPPKRLYRWNSAVECELLRELNRREGIRVSPDGGAVVAASARAIPDNQRAWAIVEAGRIAQDADSEAVCALHRVLADILRSARQAIAYN